MDKSSFRKTAFANRKLAHGTGLDRKAQDNLREALIPFRGLSLAGYMPIRTEVDPLPIMAEWDATVGVPVILGEGKPLDFHQWTKDCEMTAGPFGASVPASARAITPAVLIVPLVAFDKNCNRLGYGGGFYDRTLEGLRAKNTTIAIGYAYSAQELPELPLEPTDQQLDMIVTEQGIIQAP